MSIYILFQSNFICFCLYFSYIIFIFIFVLVLMFFECFFYLISFLFYFYFIFVCMLLLCYFYVIFTLFLCFFMLFSMLCYFNSIIMFFLLFLCYSYVILTVLVLFGLEKPMLENNFHLNCQLFLQTVLFSNARYAMVDLLLCFIKPLDPISSTQLLDIIYVFFQIRTDLTDLVLKNFVVVLYNQNIAQINSFILSF